MDFGVEFGWRFLVRIWVGLEEGVESIFRGGLGTTGPEIVDKLRGGETTLK